MPKNCKDCHHLPSGRIGYNGRQCYCKCHNLADHAPELLEVLEEARAYIRKAAGETGIGAMIEEVIANAKGN